MATLTRPRLHGSIPLQSGEGFLDYLHLIWLLF